MKVQIYPIAPPFYPLLTMGYMFQVWLHKRLLKNNSKSKTFLDFAPKAPSNSCSSFYEVEKNKNVPTKEKKEENLASGKSAQQQMLGLVDVQPI